MWQRHWSVVGVAVVVVVVVVCERGFATRTAIWTVFGVAVAVVVCERGLATRTVIWTVSVGFEGSLITASVSPNTPNLLSLCVVCVLRVVCCI